MEPFNELLRLPLLGDVDDHYLNLCQVSGLSYCAHWPGLWDALIYSVWIIIYRNWKWNILYFLWYCCFSWLLSFNNVTVTERKEKKHTCSSSDRAHSSILKHLQPAAWMLFPEHEDWAANKSAWQQRTCLVFGVDSSLDSSSSTVSEWVSKKTAVNSQRLSLCTAEVFTVVAWRCNNWRTSKKTSGSSLISVN